MAFIDVFIIVIVILESVEMILHFHPAGKKLQLLKVSSKGYGLTADRNVNLVWADNIWVKLWDY